MATFREVQDRINLDYLNRTDLGAETKRAIHRAIKHYEKTRFWFNCTATAVTINTPSTDVALPADFLALDFCTISNNGKNELVTIRNYDRIAYRNQSGVSGVPAEIAVWRNSLHFTPKATSAHSMTIHYTHSLATLSADSDTNDWLSAGEDLIVHHAMADILQNVLRVTDVAQVTAHKQWESEAYKLLKEGSDIRTNFERDLGTVGTQHQQKPKLPGSGMS